MHTIARRFDEKILSEVEQIFGITALDMKSKKRQNEIVEARQIAMYVMRETTQLSQKAIGAEFGGRDHTTVLHSVTSVKDLMAKDQVNKHLILDIIKNIRGEK